MTSFLVLVLLLGSAVPAAVHERIALDGPMRFATHDIAFVGWFVSVQAVSGASNRSAASAKTPMRGLS